MKIEEKIKKERIFFDGGMGTILQEKGLGPGESSEDWGLKNPDIITGIHKAYLDAGADVITTNTFGVNGLRYTEEEVDRYARSAVNCVREAIGDREDKYIAYDIGPSGRLIKPMGDLDFEDAVEGFSVTVRAAVKYGADVFIIETMNDSYETKAAILAVKENSDLPYIVSNAYDERGKLMTGADPETMVSIAESMGAVAVGMNCSFGPEMMIPVARKLTKAASIPVIVMPNAGLPEVIDGKSVYNVLPDEFAGYMRQMAKMGVGIMGGCCGTTPEYISTLTEAVSDIPYSYPTKKEKAYVTSFAGAVETGNGHILIGERINPTGKKAIKQALRDRDHSYIVREALKQEERGVHILDVNAGIPDIDEGATLKELVMRLQAVTDLPLQIDTADPDALEMAMRVYNGKPLVNSVNGKKESMDRVFPLINKYGGSVIALTMDEDGIPDTAEKRCEIAEKIIAEAEKYGIDKKDIIVDPLTLTISSDTSNGLVTLDCLSMLKERGIKTSLGVSNISFGLPERDIITSSFFALALDRGLDMSIMDPLSDRMMNIYHSFNALVNRDPACERYIGYASGAAPEEKKEISETDMTLSYAIQKGFSDEAERIAGELAADNEPLDIINTHLIPTLNEAGDRFDAKEIFLPQLIITADAANAAFRVLKKHMKASTDDERKIVIATVKGDLHDIGKNIVKAILESYGFNVIDLGKDVDPKTVVEESKGMKLVGLSALMTTTVPAMEETIKLLKADDPERKVMVGGAVLTERYASDIGADYYAEDAMESVRIAKEVFDGQDKV